MSSLRRAAPAALFTSIVVVSSAAAPAQNAISRVSVDPLGNQGTADSGALSRSVFSEDGRYLAFESSASNLVAGDTNGLGDVFVRDVASGAIVRVSVDSSGGEAKGQSEAPSISKDGRFVAFESTAGNLVAGDTNNAYDVFVHDRDPDQNGIFDEGNGITTRVSVRTNGNEGNADSVTPAISGDGMVVAFASGATNMVANDKNGVMDVFVRDVAGSTTTQVSVDASGTPNSNGPSSAPSITSDGRYIVFKSFAGNLIAGDLNGASDIFMYDRKAVVTTRVSVDSSGVESDGDSASARISHDGTVIAYESVATNLVANDFNFVSDIFVYDVGSAATTRVSVDSSGSEGHADSISPALSKDGQVVAFESLADNFVAGDTNFSNDVFVHERALSVTTCPTLNCVGVIANGYGSGRTSLSPDGQLVAFSSSADNLVGGDTNGAWDVFVRDRAINPPTASWLNYGSGFQGSSFIPSLTVSANPVFLSSPTLDATNSLGSATMGLLLIGANSASIGTNRGGTILVDFTLVLGISLDVGGFSIPFTVPGDINLCGQSAFLQLIEFDPGAAFGFSFTPGLQLIFGL